jgi:cation:H+ antiporter
VEVVSNIFLYLVAFVGIWWGAGLIIKAVDKIAHRLKLSSLAISFFVLGLLTSIPEMALGVNSVVERKPEIFVGTLLGGVIVIFLLIIPVLAIFGKGIRINHDLDNKTLWLAIGVIALPGLFTIDRQVTTGEGLILVAAYGVLFYVIQKKHGILDGEKTDGLQIKSYTFLDLVRVVVGIGMVFVASSCIVNQTMEFSMMLRIPILYISLIAFGLGTNLPELSLAFRAVVSEKKDIAFGDYLGSAAANTLLFGIFTLINNGVVLTTNNFLMTFGFIVIGLGLFYYFSQSKRDISTKEGMILVGIYILFVVYEVMKATMLR